MSAPPDTAANAVLFPNSKVWLAKDGVYAVQTLNTMDLPPQRMVSGGVGYMLSTTAGANPVTQMFGTLPSSISGTPSNFPTAVYPFDNSGAFFTGLSNQTTLTITVRYLYERFPSMSSSTLDTTLLTLSSPSAPWDSSALELYSRVLVELPPAVPVCENDDGSWFSRILGWIGDVAPVVGNIAGFFLPGASAVGNIVGTAAKAVGGVYAPASPSAPPPLPPRPHNVGKAKGPPPKLPPKPKVVNGRLVKRGQ
jgi:hypothetical protein